MHTTRRLAADVVGDTIVLVHSKERPDVADWDAVLAMFRAHEDHLTGAVSFTDDVGPDSLARRRIAAELDRMPFLRMAVLTDSIIARGITTALHWLGPYDVRTFPKFAIYEAATYVKGDGEAIAAFEKRARAALETATTETQPRV